ncbi:MAG TPA: ABC transporter, partial [Desulfoprunum sp.]|nr:ABC transporter [Desulfoprunum sp.]
MTILMVTHEVGFASSFFKRIACVNRQVVIHPTSRLTGHLIQEMYGCDLQMIRHDHRCSEEGHRHD